MDTATLTPEPVVTEPIAAPVVEDTSADSASIADHAEAFGPQPTERQERPAANTGQFAERPADARRRAQTQRATPEDVAEINALTKELRETEQRLGEKDPDAKSSPRIRTLKRQIAALKALEAPATTPQAEQKPVAAAPVKPVQPPTPGAFTEKEPTIEDFANADDPYLALSRAAAAYDRRKEQFEAQQKQSEQQAQQQFEEQLQGLHSRMAAFTAKTPDFGAVTADLMSRTLPAALLNGLMRDDNGPAQVYYLAQHPDIADELVIEASRLDASDDSVALMQRRVRKHVQAAQTGSASPAPTVPTYLPPRPPNPVRTGPIKTSDELPGEALSIADHARYYGRR